jgi:hypothetical protein
MNAITIVTAIIAFMAGLATESFKQWSVSWFAVRGIRKAVQAEIQAVLVHVNFYILAATDEGSSDALNAKYFSKRLSLNSFEYHWENERYMLLKLPEWPRLKNWNASLGQIRESPHPPLFNAIMLFESLTIPPLDKCLGGDSKAFVKTVLARPEVQQYRNNYFLQKSSAVP